MSAQMISWMETLAFLIILLGGFLVGFWRGLRKSTINLGVSLICAVIAFFVTPVITRLIMSVSVTIDGTHSTLQLAIVEALKKDADISQMIANSPNLEKVIENLPMAIGNVIVFILLTIVIEILASIIYNTIVIFVRDKKTAKKHRLAGGAVGLAKTFLICVFAFMPFSSMIGLCDNLTTSGDYFTTSAETTETNKYGIAGEKLPEDAIVIVKGFASSPMTKICSWSSLDDSLFDYYASFKLSGEKVTIRKELLTYYSAVDAVYEISSQENLVFSNIDYSKLDTIIENVEKSKIYSSVATQVIADVIANRENYSFIKDNSIISDYADAFSRIDNELALLADKSEYFTNDIDKIYSAFKILGQSGVLDDIANLENSDAKKIVEMLTNDKNIDYTTNALKELLDANLIKASLDTIVEKNIDTIVDGLGVDEMSVDTTSWTENDWDALAENLTEVLKCYSDVDLDVINDVTSLLKKDSEDGITETLSNLGTFLDKVLANKLLVNSSGESIFQKLLDDNDISLPEDKVLANDGTEVSITSYSELMSFISPSLEKAKSTGLYDILTESGETNEKVTSVAELISQNGNSNLLSEVLLPLYQIDFVKTKVFDNITSLNSDLMNLSSLKNYSDWKSDLGYLSSLMITLNSCTYNDGTTEQTYLSLVLNSGTETLVDNLSETEVENIFAPLLHAQSTTALKNTILGNIASVLDDITDTTNTLSVDNVTLTEGDADDQTSEIIEVIKDFIDINKNYTDGQDLTDIDKTQLGSLLTSMQTNAYKENSEGTVIGLFNASFKNLMSKLKTDYGSDCVSYIEEQKGDGYLDDTNYKNILFLDKTDESGNVTESGLMSLIKTYEDSLSA